MGIAIGIDLGTTNSCAAVIQNGRPIVITYPDGSKTIPSVFAIDKQGRALTGREAKELGDAGSTVIASKRLIGRGAGSDAIKKMSQVFTYEIQESKDKQVTIKVKDQVFTLEQISAAILRRVKDNATEALGKKVDRAVITVPAYFNDKQRQAVRRAGKLAGLKVLRVLNEPTAAALAYGLGRKLNQRVAVYDLGGGTFDISIIDIKHKVFEVIATGGDTFLGGVDFDDHVMRYLLAYIDKNWGVDLSYNRDAIARLRDASEQAKIALSSEDKVSLDLEDLGEDEDGESIRLQMDLSREKVEELTRELVERSIRCCEENFARAGTDRTEIDDLLLVGGQSRMPLVRAELEKFLGKKPSEKVHPDEAVALGAAIMAHSLAAKDKTSEVMLLDVLPMAIGLARPDGTMAILFNKNQPLPAYKTRVLKTFKTNQRSLMLRIYQGESQFIEENELLGSFVFRGLRQAPAGGVKLEVTFHVDSEGILNLTAKDQETQDVVEAQIKLDGEKKGEPRKKKRKKKAAPAPLNMPAPSVGAGPSGAPEVKPLPRMPAPPPPKQPPAQAPGFFGRIVAWFKGLFGG